MTGTLRDLDDEALFKRARPSGWQRATRLLGCPGTLVLAAMAGRAISSAGEGEPSLGRWLAGVAVFLAILPALMGLLAALSNIGKRSARKELKIRLGQGLLTPVLERLRGEFDELQDGESGWVFVVQGQRSDRQRRWFFRLDVRRTQDDADVSLQAVRGPSLNLWGKDSSSLDAWEDRRISLAGASSWLDRLDALAKIDLPEAAGRGQHRMQGALLEVGGERAVHRFGLVANHLNTHSDEPIADLIASLLAEAAWQSEVDGLRD